MTKYYKQTVRYMKKWHIDHLVAHDDDITFEFFLSTTHLVVLEYRGFECVDECTFEL